MRHGVVTRQADSCPQTATKLATVSSRFSTDVVGCRDPPRVLRYPAMYAMAHLFEGRARIGGTPEVVCRQLSPCSALVGNDCGHLVS